LTHQESKWNGSKDHSKRVPHINYREISITNKSINGVVFATVSSDKEEKMQKKDASGRRHMLLCIKIRDYSNESEYKPSKVQPNTGLNMLIMDNDSSEINRKDSDDKENSEKSKIRIMTGFKPMITKTYEE